MKENNSALACVRGVSVLRSSTTHQWPNGSGPESNTLSSTLALHSKTTCNKEEGEVREREDKCVCGIDPSLVKICNIDTGSQSISVRIQRPNPLTGFLPHPLSPPSHFVTANKKDGH